MREKKPFLTSYAKALDSYGNIKKRDMAIGLWNINMKRAVKTQNARNTSMPGMNAYIKMGNATGSTNARTANNGD